MNRGTQHRGYRTYRGNSSYGRSRRPRHKFRSIILIVLLLVAGFAAYKIFAPTPVEKAVDQLQFDASITDAEKQTIRDAIKNQEKTYSGSTTVSVNTTLEVSDASTVLAAYVPVTNVYAARQTISKSELGNVSIYVPADTDATVKSAMATALGVNDASLKPLQTSIDAIEDTAVAFIPADQLTYKVKLLALEDSYYLDTYQKGAVFRQATFTGDAATSLADLTLNSYPNKDSTLKVNMTGVTALTRLMINKLNETKDATYFSKLIGPFLRDADIVHVSNEVSFNPNCQYSTSSFCSPPQMIDTLKDSGVNLVELTGNHNNDNGNKNNTDTINEYHNLGWNTFGGGLNTTEAAKPYIADIKGSKVAFVGYNAADGLNSGVIATSSTAGGNYFTPEGAKADIAAAKKSADFVIVDMQFWECYAYPDGFVEYPICDEPIGEQESTFRQLIDDGADMVIGTQAHQPQTYEMYKGKPIYYGLGNLYFEQTRWPGTERGIILTHYFVGGKLVQTRLSPTIYGDALQTHLMDNNDAVSFLKRLSTARAAL